MKSFKKKISERNSSRISVKKPTNQQLALIQDDLESKGLWDHKKDGRKKLNDVFNKIQKLKNSIKESPLEPSIGETYTKGDYDILERLELNTENVPSRVLTKKFGRPEDYIELHIYDKKGRLLESVKNFEDYKSPLPEVSGQEDTVKAVDISPSEVLDKLGYVSGQYKLIFNFQRHKIFNTFDNMFAVKQISPSKKELKVVAPKINNDTIERQIKLFIASLETSAFFKDFTLNFGNNKCELGINLALSKVNKSKYEILVKLFEPLDDTIKIGDGFRIVEDVIDPVSFEVDLGEPENIDRTIPLRGPNFHIDTRLLNSIPSGFKTYDTALEYSLTSSYQHLLQRLENYEAPNIQYDYIRPINDTGSLDVAYHFDNFIHFGNATERLKNFKYKLNLLEVYDVQIADIDTIKGATSQSVAVLDNKQTIKDKKTNLIKGFDGYERFLYFESGTYAWPKTNSTPPYTQAYVTSSQGLTWMGSSDFNNTYYGGQLLSASLFDDQNQHSLTNLIPRHVGDNIDNEQYVLFVNMIGQHFDQIWTYIHHVTKQKDTHHKYGVSKNLVYFALKSLGLETFDQFENANLIEYILGEGTAGSPFYDAPTSQSLVTASNEGSLPKEVITKEVWKRLYHNAPYLLKHKGTERGIKALMNCYGLPTTILNVKEYGGPVKDFTGYKTFSYDKYSNSYEVDSDTSGYTIKTPWSSSALNALSSSEKTIEFRIKPKRSTEKYHLISLHNSNTSMDHDQHLILHPYTGSADMSSSGDANQYGRLEFLVNDVTRASSSYFPVFNGDFWNIFLGIENPNRGTDNIDLDFGAYQSNFLKHTSYYTSTFTTQSYYHARAWGLDITDSSYNDEGHRAGAESVYFGGVPANANANYDLIDVLRYSGSFQEIRYYFGEKLSHDTLVKHALEPFMYGGNTISSSFDSLVFRLPLGSNNILSYHASGSYDPNQNATYFSSESILSNVTSQKWASYTETHHLLTPDTVGAAMTSEKVRIDSGSIDDNILSIELKSETSTLDRQPQDYEDLGIFFSPQNEINEDIIYTLGGFRLDDYIGSPLPTAQTASSYSDLETLKDQYFKKYKNNQRYNIWDYTKLIQYIDHTLFKIIEQHVPAKANLKTGLLIEPHYLERNKFARSLPTTDEFTTMLPDSHQTFEFTLYDSPVSIISSSYIAPTSFSIGISTVKGYILDDPQFGAQAPINPTVSTGTKPFLYKPYKSSVLLGNALKGRPSNIYFRSLQLGKETEY
jgi:hypothetical protein